MGHTKRGLLIGLFACAPLFAQVNPHERLKDALVLEQQGHFNEAITVAELLTDSNQLAGVALGRAYLILGSACRIEGRFVEAQAAFESSLRILSGDPANVSDYASTLDNYAGLYSDIGQPQIAAPMWIKALHLREQGGDHAAVAQTLTALAGLALAQNRMHDAGQYLKRASGEMKLTPDPSGDDLAVFFETQAWLELAQGHPSAAVAGYQRSLELCRQTRGETNWLVGWEHMLRGKAYAQSGDTKRALADMQEGLAIIDHALSRRNPKYLLAQIAYSQILDRTGSHAEAAQLRATVKQASKDFYGSQCVRCTINIAGFR